MGIIEKMDQRLNMMGDMMRATDTDLSETVSQPTVNAYAAMVSRCMNCPAPAECKTWLAQGQEHAEAPSFCPNSEVLNK